MNALNAAEIKVEMAEDGLFDAKIDGVYVACGYSRDEAESVARERVEMLNRELCKKGGAA